MAEIKEIKILRNIEIPMRDGTILRADHFMPISDEPLPAVIARTPYLKESFHNRDCYKPIETAFKGYHILLCDTRGSGQSDGEFRPFTNERKDGYDTIQWIASQPWCSGKVGMMGLSYNGGSQLLAASTNPPGLAEIAPGEASGEFLPTFMNGILSHKTSLFWYMKQARNALLSGKGDMTPEERREKLKLVEEYMQFHSEDQCYTLPYIDAPFLKIEGLPIRHFFNEWVDNAANREYWDEMGQPMHIERIQVPCLFHAGWYDYMCPGTVANFQFMSHRTDNPELAASHRLIVGPWIHGTEFGRMQGGITYGEVSFPNNAGATDMMYSRFSSWQDRWLKGDEKADIGAPVTIYVMGENVWREEQEWPLARTQYTPLYLDSRGDARTLNGNGVLGFQKPSLSDCDEYDYDPMNPCDNSDNSIFSGKIRDRSDKELRDDVLIYTMPPLEQDLEVTGNVVAKLFVKSSAVDTDFYVRLIDMQPNGRAFGLMEGVLRMRYRDGWYDAHFMTPGEVYGIDIKLGPTSMVFKKGHAIRIEITSSDFPNNERNLNTADPVGYGKDYVVAHQTILHDEQYPSHILLPVIPR